MLKIYRSCFWGFDSWNCDLDTPPLQSIKQTKKAENDIWVFNSVIIICCLFTAHGLNKKKKRQTDKLLCVDANVCLCVRERETTGKALELHVHYNAVLSRSDKSQHFPCTRISSRYSPQCFYFLLDCFQLSFFLARAHYGLLKGSSRLQTDTLYCSLGLSVTKVWRESQKAIMPHWNDWKVRSNPKTEKTMPSR